MMAFMNIEKKNLSNKFWLGVRVGEIRCLNFSGFFSNSGIFGFLKKKKCSKPIERVCDSDFYIYCFCM